MWLTGQPGAGPMRAGAAVADVTAGLYAAIGILVALAEREKSGMGQWVQTSLLQAQIALCDFQAARYLVDGIVPPQAGNDHPYSTPMGVLETADGYINIGVGGEGQWRNFCAALGHPELADHPDFAKQDNRFANRPQLATALAPILKAKTSAEWLAAFEAHHVPAGPIYRMDEVFADPQVRHLGIAQTVTHPECGEIALVGQPVGLSRTPAALVSAIPDKGGHTEEVLVTAGFTPDQIARLRQCGVI